MKIDYEHTFSGYYGCDSVCRVRIVQLRGGPPVVLLTELDHNPGTSITNMTERIALEVITIWGLDPEATIFVEHYTAGIAPEHFARVHYAWDGHQYREPGWEHITRDEVERLLGCEVAV